MPSVTVILNSLRYYFRVHEWNDRVVFDIEDNGKGIPADEVSRLFNRFVQIERQVAQAITVQVLGWQSVKNSSKCKREISGSKKPSRRGKIILRFLKVEIHKDNSSSQIDNSTRIRL